MREPLRVGLVGYGSAGRGIHARLLREIGAHVTHVVTRSPDRADQARSDWRHVVVVPSVGALLDHAAELDLVVVASPTGEHVTHVTAAFASRLPIVVDKPLATTTDEARRLAMTAEASGARLTVFQNRRWDPEQLTLRGLLASGELGRVHRFERRWERWRPVPQQRWKENDTRSGGLLLDLGAHLVDSAVQLFGPVDTVYAELRSLTTPAEDDVFLALRHTAPHGEPGVVSHLQAGALVGAPGPRTRVLGDRGAYLVTSFEGEETPFSVLDERHDRHEKHGHGHGEHEHHAEHRAEGHVREAHVPDGGHEGWLVRGAERVAVPRAPGGHADFYRAVVAWAREGGPVPVDPWDAVRTASVLDAARISAREGRAVPVREAARH